MGLFSARPKLHGNDPHFLMQQVASLENQKSLAWIVKNEKNAVLREIAIQKLNSLKWLKLLIKTAKNEDENFHVKLFAFQKLEEYVNLVTDYEKLVEISKNGLGIGGRDGLIRKAAKKRLTAINRKIKQAQKSQNDTDAVPKKIIEKRKLDVIWEKDIPESDTYKYVPVAFSMDGKILVSGSGLKDNTLKLWKVVNGELLQTLNGHQSAISSISFHPDGKSFVSGSYDKTIILWDLESGNILKTFKGHRYTVHSVCFSPDGKTIGSCDGTNIKLWNTASGKRLKTIKGDFFVIAFSPDGKIIASSKLDEIKLFDLVSGELLKTLKTGQSVITCIAFSPDGKIIASGSNDWKLKLTDLASSKALKTFKHQSEIKGIAFSPDGKIIASSATHYNLTIRLWDTEHKRLLGKKRMLSVPLSVTFSPDGRLLGCGCKDNVVLLKIE